MKGNYTFMFRGSSSAPSAQTEKQTSASIASGTKTALPAANCRAA